VGKIYRNAEKRAANARRARHSLRKGGMRKQTVPDVSETGSAIGAGLRTAAKQL
jgi:hypothetical protein